MYNIKEITNKILLGGALTELKKFPTESVNCMVTSPPYWSLRDYSTEEIIWDEKEDCEHEWLENIQKVTGGMIGIRERLQKEKNNIKSKFVANEGYKPTDAWVRPSRTEFQNRTIFNICPVCKKQFEGKPNQTFCSIECLNTLSNEERQNTLQVSNFCKKCGAWKGQLGLEPTFDLYIKHLCDIFDEVKRVLRSDGTCWVNLGDSYGSGKGYESEDRPDVKGMEKSLCNIPARFSIEMQNRGWVLRNVIIWHKPNCMPSSVKDRFTVDFEYLFFFVKSKKYFFETQYEPIAESSKNDSRIDKGLVLHKSGKAIMKENQAGMKGCCINSFGRNKRCVWDITTQPFKEAHFATYPEELCETPIKAGCPEFVCNKCGFAREKIIESLSDKDYSNDSNYKRHIPIEYGMAHLSRNSEKMETAPKEFKGLSDCGCKDNKFEGGIVLDPFFGAGTTGLVALKQNKKFIGIELNPKYIEIAKKRLEPYLTQTKLEVNNGASNK